MFSSRTQRSQIVTPAKPPEVSRGQERILLVEDDRAVRAVTLATLTQLGYEVTDASNGDEALTAFRRNPKALICFYPTSSCLE